MQPPICELCNQDFRGQPESGGLVRFADYKPLPKGMVGHPKGLLWFCGDHFAAAQALSKHRTATALKRLRQQFEVR